jgi:type IX secretion system substrate protein
MKKIYLLLFVLLNVLVMGNNVNAQSSNCNLQYHFDTIAYNPAPFNVGTNVPFLNNTMMSDSIPIGFTFNFYGIDYTYLVVAPIGYITFNDTTANGTPNNHTEFNLNGLPASDYAYNSIFLLGGYWDPLIITGTTKIKYNLTGTSPYRQLVIAYDSLQVTNPGFGNTTYATAEIIIYETTNIIETYIKYGPDLWDYSNVVGIVLGIQNNTATKGTEGGVVTNLVNPIIDYGGRYTPYFAPLSSTPICIVSVDSATQKNIVIWNQPLGVPIDSFLIFRETNQAGVYAQIGTQLGTVFSTFIDTGSYPAIQANRYRLGFRDSCGVVSDTSAEHKTIHLLVNQGMNNSWNLTWDAYEGFTFASYYIYRGPAPDSMALMATIASNLYSYTDLTPPPVVYYAIEVVNPNGCNPSARMESSSSTSMSNIFNPVFTTGINEADELNNVSIFPNPANSVLNIKFNSAKNYEVIVSNVLGEEIYHQPISNSTQTTINISQLSNGVYFYQLKNDKETMQGKFIVEK